MVDVIDVSSEVQVTWSFIPVKAELVSFTATPTSAATGATVTITAALRNIGEVTGNLYARVLEGDVAIVIGSRHGTYEIPPGMTLIGERKTVTTPPGATATFTWAYIMPSGTVTHKLKLEGGHPEAD